MGKTSIEWTDRAWPVIDGCRSCSSGCENCYAARLAATRLKNTPRYKRLAVMKNSGPQWTGKTRFIEKEIYVPIRTRKPSRFFVCNMGDLFYEDVPDEWIDRVLAVMLLSPQHTFQVLTKRAKRMHDYLLAPDLYTRVLRQADIVRVDLRNARLPRLAMHNVGISDPALIPAKWIWWGVSVEDQKTAEERIPWLLASPAALRWVSYEPALGLVNFNHLDVERAGLDMYWVNALTGRNTDMGRPCRDVQKLDWIVVGGESGPGARSTDMAWIRRTVTDCRNAGVACFVKQLGAYPTSSDTDDRYGHRMQPHLSGPSRIVLQHKKGANMPEWPLDLRVREWPVAA